MTTVQLSAGLSVLTEQSFESTEDILSYFRSPPTQDEHEPPRKKQRTARFVAASSLHSSQADAIVLARIDVHLVGYLSPMHNMVLTVSAAKVLEYKC